MDKVRRRGDYSPRSFIELVRYRCGISIRCHIDPSRRFEAPNPKFCGAMAAGRSLTTYQVLWQLYDRLPTDHHRHAFILSEQGDSSQFLIMRKSDVIVATENDRGEYGVEVFVKRDSPVFEEVESLYQAIERDNIIEPQWNA